MRRIYSIFALLLAALLWPPPLGAEAPAAVKGLFLITDYPALTVRAGETTTVKLKLQNYNLPPARVALSVDGVPAGWKAALLGGGQPVAAAMPATNESVNLQLRIDVPAEVSAGTHTFTVAARGPDASASLPVQVTLGDALPAKLALKSKLPALLGSPHSSFDYELTATNDSGKDLLVQLAAAAPPNFQTSFTEGYGSQEVSSVPIEAGQSKTLKLKVQPPADIAAGDYKVVARVAAEGAAAQAPLTMQISGQPKLKLSGQQGRLSGEAEAGKATTFTLVVSNDGSAPATDVEISGSPPSDWQTSFEPKKIARLEPNQKSEVQAMLTPSAKAVAGDYMTTFRASTKGDSSAADFRVTVTTSTLWGIVGVVLIAAALLVVVGAVARFGRR